MGTFGQRTRELEEMVGDGDLVGHFVVSQPYAAVIHEGGWLNFLGKYGRKRIKRHRDGTPVPSKFVETPLKVLYPEHYQDLADNVLEGTVREAMAENLEEQDEALRAFAPELTGALKRSGNRIVVDDGDLFSYVPQDAPYDATGEPFDEAEAMGVEY